MSVGRAVAMIGAVFCLTLAIIIVRELSSEALAVAIGVACGIAAGIPVTILLYVALARRLRRAEDERRPAQRGEVPPLIIVQGQGWPPPLPQETWLMPPEGPGPRNHVRLVGGEDLLRDQDNRG
jgi:drug/metabolite transporter (DMT)-like permease